MSFVFKRAFRENVSLLIGIAGGTGSGKTYSAMRLASGISGDKPFAVIDTEAGRAKHYADQFKFDHGDLSPPFRPDAYIDAIHAADKAGYRVIVVDSMSHVWSGDGGVLDWQEYELNRMAGDDWKKRESCKMAAWIKPKVSHKQMVQRLLQIRAHLILCFRAEEKIEMVNDRKGVLSELEETRSQLKDARPSEIGEIEKRIAQLTEKLKTADSKTKIAPKKGATGLNGWFPVCEKNLPYELTASLLLTADAPGIPKPIKLQQQHRALFTLDKSIDEESGKKIAEWAAGASVLDDPLKKMIEAFNLIGVTESALTSHLGYAATMADMPQLRKYYTDVKNRGNGSII